MLTIDSLTVRLGHRVVIDALSAGFEPGRIELVLGHNGAGKSTLLRAIAGLLRPSGGGVLLDGVDIARRTPSDVARAGVVLVPQGRGIFADLTVAENIRLGMWNTRRLKRGTAQEERARLDEARELFPVLGQLWNTRAGSLSGGQQQQVAIARAFLANPRVLLLDEPSVGLSPKLAELVLSTVASLRRDDRTIVLVEQNVHQALAVADTVAIMRAGVMERHGLAPADIARQDLTTVF
ncbi:ABC transporter ATP-binding protein [Sphaerisporangium rufum]|uniref:ABC transporter ATP-binding protein n=1 Tax=Sphaerisporangium rufum TaxID=1381558 RepID=A0A919V4C7_9ACTN|nr:ABC transporter ATP-binding protein [Sphaerisporangium rufum]GII81043.1 ABC transporter ATP-binding protein [Sphaerisporangium rufum]